MSLPNPQDRWKKVRKTLFWSLALAILGCGGLSYWLWGLSQAITAEAAILCLASGFWITEMLVGVFTKVKSANATAIALLFLAKIGWWGTLFWGAKNLPAGHDGAVATGMGFFLIALLFSALRHYGMPRISDVERPRDP